MGRAQRGDASGPVRQAMTSMGNRGGGLDVGVWGWMTREKERVWRCM